MSEQALNSSIHFEVQDAHIPKSKPVQAPNLSNYFLWDLELQTELSQGEQLRKGKRQATKRAQKPDPVLMDSSNQERERERKLRPALRFAPVECIHLKVVSGGRSEAQHLAPIAKRGNRKTIVSAGT